MNNSSVEIFVNGTFKGTGTAEIKRTGPPQKAEVVAKYHGTEIGSLLIKRQFDWVSLLVGCNSYGLGFIFCWRFPEMVFILTDMQNQPDNNIYASPWYMPSSKWDKK